MKDILLGPLLGIESDETYTVCLSTHYGVDRVVLVIDSTNILFDAIGNTPTSTVWRAQYNINKPSTSKKITYQILIDKEVGQNSAGDHEWTIHVPSDDIQFIYSSCNGFSSNDLRFRTRDHYSLWSKMRLHHEAVPISLLVMGGDQVYADSIWSTIPELRKWCSKSEAEKLAYRCSPSLIDEIDAFYDELYRESWSNKDMSYMLGCVPSIMMWDDHDIFDGWGSHSIEMQLCHVHRTIYKVAKKYFLMYQLRSSKNQSLLSSDLNHYAFHLKYRGNSFLALDLRSYRRKSVILSNPQWETIKRLLVDEIASDNVYILASIPLIYRDFRKSEKIIDFTPTVEEITDDIKDQWNTKGHRGDMARMLTYIKSNDVRRKKVNPISRTAILSGDIHVGGLGLMLSDDCKVFQVISSGIVHPPPSAMSWIGIETVTSDSDSYLDNESSTKLSMVTPYGSDRYIRSRNYSRFHIENNVLWVNWETENSDKPYYPLK